MRSPGGQCSRAGLTLVEMAFVIALLAVLGSVAIPQYRHYIYRSQRAEALHGLRTIWNLQTDYFQKQSQYSDSFQELGTPLSRGRILDDGSFQGDFYTFTLDTWDVNGQTNANYRAMATANLDPSDDTLDILIIENDLKVLN